MKQGTVAVGFLDSGEWSQSFGQSLIDLYLTDATTSQRIVPAGKQLRTFCSTGGLVEARNKVAREFLDSTECEWLFMVDSDMGFAPDTVDRLIASADRYQRPVMGGLCFALRRAETGPLHVTRYVTVPTVYDFVEDAGKVGFRSVTSYPEGVAKVDATGAACLLVHRHALHKIREAEGDGWFDLVTHAGSTFSEDLSFCLRLTAAGIPVHVDTSVKTSHYKGGVYLDEQHYLAQRVPEMV